MISEMTMMPPKKKSTTKATPAAGPINPGYEKTPRQLASASADAVDDSARRARYRMRRALEAAHRLPPDSTHAPTVCEDVPSHERKPSHRNEPDPCPPRQLEHHRKPVHQRDCNEDDPPSKIVERIWYFDCDDERGHGGGHGHGDNCDDDGYGGHYGDGGGHGRPGRPTRPPGVDTGRLDEGGPLTPGDIHQPNEPGVWGGTRADMDLPYLFMRANPADVGVRPITGAPFWESPDIFILGGVAPSAAPAIPPELGQIAIAGEPNTLYAHVWNFGKAAASEVVVEFYWVDPSLGISPSSLHMIAQTFMTLGAKGSGHAHAVIKCPEAWTPTFVNGGHECLLVRVWDNPSDLPGEPKFDASVNRHVAQRNIHVIPASAHAHALIINPDSGLAKVRQALAAPLMLKVGPLFGAPATVNVERVMPHSVPWLQLHSGQRGVFPGMATPTGTPLLSPPVTAGGGFPSTGGQPQQQVEGDDQHVGFSTSDEAPGPGEAHVYRISAGQDGTVFGGYTVVILG
jgi:hypothetical protein